MKTKSLILFLSLIPFLSVFGQMHDYNYQRGLTGITDPWHKIVLPDEIFGKIKHDFSDLRIFGITDKNDTSEAPFILQVDLDELEQQEIQFTLLNQVNRDNVFYYTFEIPAAKAVNQIILDFAETNYDWKVSLAGSQDQQEWFSILQDYRLLSVQNQLTSYTFSTLIFPEAKYRYLRLQILAKDQPELVSAVIGERILLKGKYRSYSIHDSQIEQERDSRKTIISISIPLLVPISYLKLTVKDQFDFYRPITIQFVVDSVQTPQGWKYQYQDLFHGIFSSLESGEFKFSNTFARQLKVIIENYDSPVLQIDSIQVMGNIHELIVRFTEPARYYLVYGNPKAYAPTYDLIHLKDKIPLVSTELSLNREESISKIDKPERGPLFQNPAWLWTILIAIILLLGWFAMRMLKK